MKRFREILTLFLEFMKFGCFTFGGGWSIVSQMQKLYVERKKTITAEELLDLTSVSRSLPGTMIGNVAMLYGYRMAGYPGGVVCAIGLTLPPLAILAVITHFYTLFRANVWVAAAMTGVRAAVVPIILSAVLGLIKGAFQYPPCYAVAALTLGLYLIWNVNCVWLVLIGALCGIVICEVYERRNGNAAA
ncbi:MAG: chromate transporter [Eubacteriales bacterium]